MQRASRTFDVTWLMTDMLRGHAYVVDGDRPAWWIGALIGAEWLRITSPASPLLLASENLWPGANLRWLFFLFVASASVCYEVRVKMLDFDEFCLLEPLSF